MKTLLDIFSKIFEKKYLKYHAIVLVAIAGIIYMNQSGMSMSTQDHKIAKNTALRDMFHQQRSQTHKDEAEKNWADKFFNIRFD